MNNKVGEWCDKIIIFSFCALIFFLPISVALVEIFATIALFAFFTKRGFVFKDNLREHSLAGPPLSVIDKAGLFLKSYKPVTSSLSWPVAIFILVNFLSMIFSQYPDLSIKGFFAKIMQSTFIYFTFIEGFKTKKHLTIFTIVFLIGTALIASNGVYQAATWKGFIRGNELAGHRVNSSLRQANDFGTYLVVTTSLALSFFMFAWYLGKKKSASGDQTGSLSDQFTGWAFKIFIPLVFLLSFNCLGLTYSRGAWVGFMVSLMYIGFWNKRIIPFLFLGVVIFFMIFLPRMAIIRNVSFVTDDVAKHEVHDAPEEGDGESGGSMGSFKQRAESLKAFTGMGRKSFWKGAFAIIAEYPFFGIGLNTYSHFTKERRLTQGVYPHNCYIHMAAEIGLTGLTVFFWLIFRIFKNIAKNFHSVKDPFLQCLLLASGAGLLGFLIHSIFDTNIYSVQLSNMMWILMGVIVATQKIALGQQSA